MPGPKMGTRPPDFDEDVVRKAPTFQKWLTLKDGQKIRYACRDFVKGHGQDEERLMRRIMIARRNNVRDHEILKKAREVSGDEPVPPIKTEVVETPAPAEVVEEESVIETLAIDEPPAKLRKISPSHAIADDEMDEKAVMATRSYKAWLALEEGKEFAYNQKYIKGKEGHDFLLKKNIWRRMRYRRENKKMVEKLKAKSGFTVSNTIPRKGVKREEPTETGFFDLDDADHLDAEGSASVTDSEEKIQAAAETRSFLDAIAASAQIAMSDFTNAVKLDLSDPPPISALDATALEMNGSALEAAYKLAAATANAEEVAAAVAAAIQGNDDDDTEDEEEEEEDDEDLVDDDDDEEEEEEQHHEYEHEETSRAVVDGEETVDV